MAAIDKSLLLITSATPIPRRVRNTQRIAAVLLNGRYLDRQALDELLKAAERAASRH
jgi:hypothetical protein